MNGYCGECDKQIEFHRGTVKKELSESKDEVTVYLVCPWCEEKEEITKVSI